MALENYQVAIQLNHLYKALPTSISGSPQLRANIFVNSGSVNVYSSNSATQPTSLSQMVSVDDDLDVKGTKEVYIIPKYIAVVQNAGTTTELIMSLVQMEDLGELLG